MEIGPKLMIGGAECIRFAHGKAGLGNINGEMGAAIPQIGQGWGNNLGRF